MQTDFDRDLLAYFTDVEYLRDVFRQTVAAPTLTKRLFVIHGVGGVGKSSLLSIFRLNCKSVKVPVALASGDETKSALGVLTHWTDDLKTHGVALPSFGKTFKHYREIQAKVDAQAKKTTGGRAVDIAGKAASKTAEAAGGVLAGAAIGSIIPGIGTAIGGVLGGVLGGMGAEALVDWLRGFLKQPDIDLLLDPTKKLTNDFLADLAQAANKQRIVLMLDTFEQMTALDDWARDIAQRLHTNILLVIAGRALPNWSRVWQSWMANAHVEELQPMTEDVMHKLVQRYYGTMRGGEPNPTQVEAIIRFARGLPIVVTSVVRLWIKYPDSVGDLNPVKPEVMADLVDLLMEGVPKALIPALEAAAVVRWFDQPILRAVTGLADVRDVYNELRRFPFVRTRSEGLALHDAVREIMDENLRIQDTERHHELHGRAVAHFEKRLGESVANPHHPITNKEAKDHLIEFLYHRIMIDEGDGFYLAKSTFDTSLRQYALVFCDELLALLRAFKFSNREKGCWTDYLSLQIVQARSSWENAFDELENLLAQDLPPELETEARWNLGLTLDYLGKRDRALQELSNALKVSRVDNVPNLEIQAKILMRLGGLEGTLIDFESGFNRLSEALVIAQQTGNKRLIIDTLNEKSYLLQKYGRFDEAKPLLEDVVRLSKTILDEREQGLALARLGEALINLGDFSAEAFEHLEKATYFLQKVDDIQSLSWANRNLGSWFMGRKDPQSARSFYERGVDGYRRRKATRGLFRTQVALCECYLELSRFEEISKLAPEIEDLGPRVVMNEWTARWRLVQGHVALDGHIPEWGKGIDVALGFYKLALVFALRYNRFLLDEVLSGRPQGTPLRPIIPYGLERGQDGKQMLTALHDWWKTGVNDIGLSRPDTVSSIPEGIALMETERIAREREPGDGSPQKSVVEQIEAALENS